MNGDVRDFVDRIHYGDELVFMYRGQKFFLEGLFQDDNKFTTYLDRWDFREPIISGLAKEIKPTLCRNF